MEVERKFRVDRVKLDISSFINPVVRHMTQTYIEICEDGTEKRVRKDTSDTTTDILYLYTEKGPGTVSRREKNKLITAKMYKKLLSKGFIGDTIYKDRYTLHTKSNILIELDIYKEQLSGLVVAEVEFKDGNLTQRIAKAKSFTLPDEIASAVIEEVTEDTRYQNKNLALYGLPRH